MVICLMATEWGGGLLPSHFLALACSPNTLPKHLKTDCVSVTEIISNSNSQQLRAAVISMAEAGGLHLHRADDVPLELIEQVIETVPGTMAERWGQWVELTARRLGLVVRSVEGAFDDVLSTVAHAQAACFLVGEQLCVVHAAGAKFEWVNASAAGKQVISARELKGRLKDAVKSCVVVLEKVRSAHDESAHQHGHEHPAPWSRLFSLMKPDRSDIITLFVFSVVVGLLSLATPIAVEALVNTVAFGRLLQPVVVLSVLLFACLAFVGVLRAWQAYVVELIQRKLFTRVSLLIAERLPRLNSHEVHEHTPTLLNYFLEVATVQKVAAQLLLTGIETLLATLVGLMVLGFYHPALLMFDFGLLLAIVFVVFGLARRAVDTSIAESKRKYELAHWFQDVARCPIAFRQDESPEFVWQATQTRVADYLFARASHFRIQFRQVMASFAMQACASTALLGLGGWLVISGQLTLGQLVAAELIVSGIVASFTKLGKHLESWYDLMASMDKIGHVLDLPIERSSGAMHVSRDEFRFELRGILDPAFASSDPLSLELTTGDSIALTSSQADDAAFAAFNDSLIGAREIASGAVLLDAIDQRELRLDVWRRHVGLARGTEVFSGSIFENVRVGRASVSAADVRHSLLEVGLLDEILSLPHGVQSELLSDGSPLSDSQRRRLTLARVLAGQPRVVLIDGVLDGLSDDELGALLPRLLADKSRIWIVSSRRAAVLKHFERVRELG